MLDQRPQAIFPFASTTQHNYQHTHHNPSKNTKLTSTRWSPGSSRLQRRGPRLHRRSRIYTRTITRNNPLPKSLPHLPLPPLRRRPRPSKSRRRSTENKSRLHTRPTRRPNNSNHRRGCKTIHLCRRSAAEVHH